jgi:hypothetical protein
VCVLALQSLAEPALIPRHFLNLNFWYRFGSTGSRAPVSLFVLLIFILLRVTNNNGVWIGRLDLLVRYYNYINYSHL